MSVTIVMHLLKIGDLQWKKNTSKREQTTPGK